MGLSKMVYQLIICATMKRIVLLLFTLISLIVCSCESPMEGSTRDVIVNLTSYSILHTTKQVSVDASLKVRQIRHNGEWKPTQVVATIYSSIVSDDSTAKLSLFLNSDSLGIVPPTSNSMQFDERDLYLNQYRNYDLEAYYCEYYYYNNTYLSLYEIIYPLWRVEYNELLQSNKNTISIETSPVFRHETERVEKNL